MKRRWAKAFKRAGMSRLGWAMGSFAVAGALKGLKRRRYRLKNKVVLITGGSRGLGLELARRFGMEGARLALCARDEAELKQARVELEGAGATVFTHVCDLRDEAQTEALATAVLDHYGSVDVLVNNAGIIQVGPLESTTEEDFRQALDLHLWAPLRLTKLLAPQMRQRGEGRIVNISSFGGKRGVPHLVPYSVSKFALTGLTEGLRAELAGDGILVTGVYPFVMRTGSPEHALFKGKHEAEFAWMVLGASVPFLTVGSSRAAREIVEACREGRAELILGGPTHLITLGQALAPELVNAAFGVMGRILPKGDSKEAHLGADSHTKLTRSPLTWLHRRAAERNNELTSLS